jgi:hypothetical protein
MSITGVEFEDAWPNREVVDIDGLQLSFISKLDLIRNKEAYGRPQDMIDVENLKSTEQEN